MRIRTLTVAVGVVFVAASAVLAAGLNRRYLSSRAARQPSGAIDRAAVGGGRAGEPRVAERVIGGGYCAVQPPSITSSLPVTNRDSSEAR